MDAGAGVSIQTARKASHEAAVMVRYSSKFLYRPMFKADLPHPPHVPDHNSFYTAPRSRWVPHYLVFSDKPIRFLYRPTPKVGRVFIEQAAVCKFLYRPTPKVGPICRDRWRCQTSFYTDPRLRWVFTPSHISKTW